MSGMGVGAIVRHYGNVRPEGETNGPSTEFRRAEHGVCRTFDDFMVDVQRIVGFGNTVLAEVRYRATARATGKPLDAQAAHIFDFRNGKCVRYQHYSDTWQFAEVTGIMPVR